MLTVVTELRHKICRALSNAEWMQCKKSECKKCKTKKNK